jgi:hypothetical protein
VAAKLRYVCSSCVHDDALSALIREEGEKQICGFCGAKCSSLSLQELTDQILERISWEYSDVDSEMVPYDGEEQEYFCDIYTSEELLSDQIGLDARPEVILEIAQLMPDLTWCKRQLRSGDLGAALNSGWKSFIDVVKHHVRYFFSEPHDAHRGGRFDDFPNPEVFGIEYDPDEGVPPERILDAIGSIVRRAKLIRSLDSGSIIFRARVQAVHEKPATAEELGPPSTELAVQSNRMSPAGIVMSYGAFDSPTAIGETFQLDRERAADKVVSVGQFRSSRPLTVLDLTNLPSTPSFFGDYEMHHGISFLWDFNRDLTKPIARDGMEHVDYVPTQIVSEYFRHRFKTKEELLLDGIIYLSSRTGSPACVLFFDQSDCGGVASATTPALQLLEDATKRLLGSELIYMAQAAKKPR